MKIQQLVYLVAVLNFNLILFRKLEPWLKNQQMVDSRTTTLYTVLDILQKFLSYRQLYVAISDAYCSDSLV